MMNDFFICVFYNAKALRPLPSEWHGLADVETRYRFRELDTLTNDEVKNIFITRMINVES